MVKRSIFLIFSAFLGLSVLSQAQSDTTNQGGDSQQQGVDCNDPLNANSLSCQLGYGQTGQQSGYPSDQQSGFPNGQLGGVGGTQSGRSTGNNGLQNGSTYTDNGGTQRNQGNLPTRPLPPEPLTDFQRMVASTSGQVLPIFGQDLFRSVPSTFAPVDQIPVTADYVVGPGDEVRIRVWGQVNLNADVRVDRSGDIYLPQVGRIHVTGTAFSDLSQQIRTQISRVYRNFDLTVDLGQLRSIQIFVVGQARRPGAYTVSSLSTLVNAIFASGGPSVQGTMRDIQLKRDGKVITTFDFYDLLIRGDKSKDARLLPGDVIYIPAVGPQVALTGSVRKPAIYELIPANGEGGGPSSKQPSNTMQQLIDDAGGLSTIASGSRMSIERIDEHRDRQTLEVALDAAGLVTVLRDGDVIRVLSIVPAFQKTVTLRGNLANPGRFEWHEGMKLSDLIPDRPSLITRNYWWRRAQLGLPSPEFQPLSGRGPLYQPTTPGYLPKQLPRPYYGPNPFGANAPGNNQSGANASGTNSSGGTNSSSANPYNSYPYGVLQGTASQPYSQELPSDFQAQPQANTQYSNSPYPPDNTSNSAPGNSPQSSTTQAAQSESTGTTLGEQQGGVITQNIANAGPKVTVTLSAPEIDWDYAVIERLDPNTLKTSLMPFNLGKLVIDHDPSQDFALQPGDVVTIFSQADIRVPLAQQTKFVKLDGEIVSAGVYSVGPGETLRDVVRRAGGFTPNAYIFGSEFTRESTRVFQQQRLDEYVQSLDLQIQRGQLNAAASAASPQDSAAVSAAAINQQGLLAKLHQLRASGRIVLEVKPDSSGLDSIPEIQLQDDDHFVVPSVPAGVNVVGAVYDQNSFLYQPQRRVGDYLRLAGGPNRNADKGHIFIVRADGSVYSRERANGLWGNNFEATRMYPGDNIVIPEKVLGTSVLRNFINWSQVFSSLAFGAAAISVLHNN
jgi:protein involved in polysaccharide export with SLBB domain